MNTSESSHVRRTPITRILAEQALGLSAVSAPANVSLLIKQCLLDWIGVSIVGAHAPLTRILREELSQQGGHPQAIIIEDSIKLPKARDDVAVVAVIGVAMPENVFFTSPPTFFHLQST